MEFTVEVPEDFDNIRLPTLDFFYWMKNGILSHIYFQKEMKTHPRKNSYGKTANYGDS